MKMNNKGFVATSILYGVVALLLITFLLLLSYYLTENSGNRTIVSDIKEDLGDFKYETIKTVELDPNGGSVYPKKISVKYDGIFGAIPDATRDGYNFLGWYTSVDSGFVVTSSTAYNDVKAKKLYAHWEKGKFNLTIDPVGGTIKESNDEEGSTSERVIQLEYEEQYTVPEPTKVGYTFKGWKLEGAESVISGNLFTMGYQNAKLTAEWEINKYSLKVAVLDGVWNNSTEDQTFELEYKETLEIPNPIKDGHTFIGWELVGENSELNSTIFTMGTNDAQLIAKWKANEYSVFIFHHQQNVDGNGYTLVDADTEKYDLLFGTEVEFLTKTYKGFTSPQRISHTVTSNDEENKINYEYLRNKYTLTIMPNKGIWNNTSNSSEFEMYYNSTKEIENPERAGYTFTGWTVSSGDLNDNSYKISDSDAILTANWDVNNYIVTFNANGGSVEAATYEYTFDNKYETLPTPTRNGYTFLGWFTEKDGGTEVTTDTIVSNPNDHTLYAHWQINTYRLTIDPAGGSWNNSTTSQTFVLTYDTTKNIPIPTKKRYTFTGWTLTGTGSLMTSLTETSTFTMGYQDATLVANWEPNLAEYVQYTNPEYTSCTNMACAFDELFEKATGTPTYTVTLNANGGSVSPNTITVAYESKYGELPIPTRSNYKFLGWYTDTNYTTLITATSIYNQNKNQTLYAKWEQITLAEYITNLSKTNTSELRVDTHAATGQQTFATTEYRYFGASPNNYVSFNGEMWRIIGVFDVDDGTGKIEKRVKIIRDVPLGNMAWDNSSSNNSHGINEWNVASLKKLLNEGEYYNRTSGTCAIRNQNDATISCDFSTTGLTNDAKALIGNAKWYLGATTVSQLTAAEMYANERSTASSKQCSSGTLCNDNVERKTYWVGSVGLMYASDYGYAANMSTCSNSLLYPDYKTTCVSSDWLANTVYDEQWTLTPWGSSAEACYADIVLASGNVVNRNVSGMRGVRPVVYLSAGVKYNGGTGTSGTNAFQISK